MNKSLSEYFDALERLIANSPKIVPRGTRISNDAVSLEAGRKKGSIKKSREQYSALIVAIEGAQKRQCGPDVVEAEKLMRLRATVTQLKQELEAALAREFSLVIELRKVRSQLTKANSASVTGIRTKR